MFSIGPDFYVLPVLTPPQLHGMSSFLAGVPPKHSEVTYVKKNHFNTTHIQLPFTFLHVDMAVRAGSEGGRLVLHFILSFQVYAVV